MVQQTINMRDYKITRNKGELYNVQVTDSYGNKYQNYFDTAHKANEWVYYVWDNEEWFNSTNSQELLANAIETCKRIEEMTKSNIQCKNITKNVSSLCQVHDPNHIKSSDKLTVICSGTTKKNTKCKNKTKNKSGLCHNHQPTKD